PPFALLAVSTSRLHLPASLRSTGITRLLRYYGRSDSCRDGRCGFAPVFRSLQPRRELQARSVGVWPDQKPHLPEVPVLIPGRSPLFTTRTFRPFRLQPPVALPVGRSGRVPYRADAIWTSPFTRRLARTTGRIEFACATDWTFTCGCS